MAHLMRKVAIIGFIAMNSPLLAGKSDDLAPEAPAIQQPAAASAPAVRAGHGGLTAAREAAQILAALDPAIRDRVLGAAASFGAGTTSHR